MSLRSFRWRLSLRATAIPSLVVFLLLTSAMTLSAQDPMVVTQQYLDARSAKLGLTPADIADLEITDSHTSRQSGVTYVYLRQRHKGIPVANGVANAAIRDGQVVHFGNRLIGGLSDKARTQQPALTPAEGVAAAARHLALPAPRALTMVEAISPIEYKFNDAGISQKDIPVNLMYRAMDDGQVKLVWDMFIMTKDGEHWWSVQVDATDGSLAGQQDLVVRCSFEQSPFARHTHTSACTVQAPAVPAALPALGIGTYNVVPLPAESPNHGPLALVPDPSDPIASPYGWHDVDGADGAEFTITQGNNVHAYEDRDNDNFPGFSPDGGAALEFNFPYNPLLDPVGYESAAITNLFYMNNMMHDIWYQYGFDEVSGNFQANNYQLGGIEGDYVLAEAQDGGGLNNANFGTPPDGGNPRMQMYLWQNTVPSKYLVIHAPDSIAGDYIATAATFGAPLPDVPLTGEIVLVEDSSEPVHDGCQPIVNAAQLAGRIALVDRGNCTFVAKVQAAQDAGAIAVIVVSNLPGPPTQMGGSSGSIVIPAIMISMADGDSIKAYLPLGPVTASINDGTGVVTDIFDGDFDNGIIAHEYGHGISTRLVGGSNNVECLFNAEQMGEGWSDWFGLMLTMEPGDTGAEVRGIGTFATNEPTDGRGIRPAPYSTDFNVNGYTYGASNNASSISQPHGVGFIWATMLWDLNWALIDAYGGVPDPDLYTGSGGNNIAMHLVIEGLKLTKCEPGMEDGRDAILAADQILYDGAHQCLIWEVFARRGLGYSADQGESDSRTDQFEAFDLPTICQTAVEPPVAAFATDTLIECTKTVAFTDESTRIPQSWSWDFGDGATSTERNPVHTYALGGAYIVKLIVTNTLGIDSMIRTIELVLPQAPVTDDQEACIGEDAAIIATATGRVVWRDTSGAVIHVGDTLLVNGIAFDQVYYTVNEVGEPSQFVGPADGSFGSGGYHGTGYFGATNFTAEKGFTILSAWVDAPNPGPRTFLLGRGTNFDGEPPVGPDLVDQVTVDVPAGQSRIALDLEVPEAGDYYIGASLSNGSRLFRNDGGAVFPYVLPGYMTLTSSSANSNPFSFYYYLYNLEVREGDLCISDPDTVRVTGARSAFTFVEEVDLVLSFTDASVGARTWSWDFGDGNTSNEQNPIHTYADEGEYTITLTINDGLCSSTQTYTVLISGTGGNLRPLALALEPNPANAITTLRLTAPVSEDLDVLVKDMSGKSVGGFVLPAGSASLDVDVSGWPSALYIVQVKGRSYAAVRKLVVE